MGKPRRCFPSLSYPAAQLDRSESRRVSSAAMVCVPRREDRCRASAPTVGISADQPGVDVGRAARGQHRRLAALAHHHPGPAANLAGHGLRDGQATIATLRHRLIWRTRTPCPPQGAITLRLSPGHHLVAEILTRLLPCPQRPD